MKWFWKRNTNCDHFQAGLKKLQRDDIEGAINCWNQAIQLNPRHIDALLLPRRCKTTPDGLHRCTFRFEPCVGIRAPID